MKKLLMSVFCMLSLCTALAAQDIVGFWKSVDDKTNTTQCIVAVYEYQGKYYGRIIGTFDDNGVIKDSIYAPIKRASGILGNPFYAGLDLIWNLKNNKSRFCGKIVDPQKGKVYNAELWVKDGNLIVRGKLLFFGRNQVWLPASDKDFSPKFQKPDVTKFIPIIPVVKSDS